MRKSMLTYLRLRKESRVSALTSAQLRDWWFIDFPHITYGDSLYGWTVASIFFYACKS